MSAAVTPTFKPEELAEELGISGKQVRSYLRSTFTRAPEAKGTTWVLSQDQADATREHFIALRPADEAVEEAPAEA